MNTITIRTGLGHDIDVRAVVCGDWAYHRSVGSSQMWTITHVPSGLQAVTWISLPAVKRGMKALADLPRFTVPKHPKRSKRYRAVGMEIRRRLAEAEKPVCAS